MAAPIRISHASTSHFNNRQQVECMSLPPVLPAVPVSMHGDQVPSLTASFAGAPRASDLLVHQLQNLPSSSDELTSRRSRCSSMSEADPRRFCSSSSRSPSHEQDVHNSAMRLKGTLSIAQPSLLTSVGKLWSNLRQERSLSPVEASPSPVDSCASSPPEYMTPHSVLFNRAADTSATESVTPGTSWSSCSKCSSESGETYETICTSSEALDEAVDGKTLFIHPDTSNASLSQMLRTSQRPVAKRQHSKNNVVMPSDSRSPLQDDTQTIGAPSDSESRTLSPSRSRESSPGALATVEPSSRTDLTSMMEPTEPEHSAKEPTDFSAYVSGIGYPIDPDTEFSSVAQLQTFRIHSRSRSIGPGDVRSERSSSGQRYAETYDVSRSFSLASHERSRALSPRPPLLNVRDTELIPSLSALGAAVCNPGYQLKPHPGANETPRPVDEHTPPASPRLCAQPKAPLMVDGVFQLDAIPDASVDENGFSTVVSRSARRRQRRDSNQRASRPPAEEPMPIDPDAIPEPVERTEDEETDEDCHRGRTRDRNRRVRSNAMQNTKPLGSVMFNASSSVVAARKPNGTRRSTRTRQSGVSYADAATVGRSHDQPADADEHSLRGRRGAVKVVASSDGAPTVPLSRLPNTQLPGTPISLGTEGESPVTRPRLLSNGAHLLMLSLELAMIRNNKITAPLKARWGKCRDDDFRPIPTPQARMKLMLSRDCQHCDVPNPLCDMCPLLEECGSRLKHAWSP